MLNINGTRSKSLCPSFTEEGWYEFSYNLITKCSIYRQYFKGYWREVFSFTMSIIKLL